MEIVKEDREFVFEESLYVLDEDNQKSVIVYFLSDLILLAERDGICLKLWRYIELN